MGDMALGREIASESAPSPSQSLNLPVHPLWMTRNRAVLRTAFLVILLWSGTIVALLVISMHSPRASIGYDIFGTASAIALLLLSVWALDRRVTRALRFRKSPDPHIVASQSGVAGEAYPLERYRPIPSSNPNLSGFAPSALVIRSLVFRQVAEVTERANFIPWSRTTLVLDRFGQELRVGFWTKDIRTENGVFHDVICLIPEGEVLALFSLASSGGADVHVGQGLVSDVGRNVSIPCPRHDTPIGGSRVPDRPARLPTPRSPLEQTGWFNLGAEGSR
jgi:hypothetical protein